MERIDRKMRRFCGITAVWIFHLQSFLAFCENISSYQFVNQNMSQVGYEFDERKCDEFAFSYEGKEYCKQGSTEYFFCDDGKTRLNIGKLCDSKYDCPDHSDEQFGGPGFKCVVRSLIANLCVLPQINLYDDVSQCKNSKDICFDLDGVLTTECFLCVDGNHIVSKDQVCDGILDCMDFSDECLCYNHWKTPFVCANYPQIFNSSCENASSMFHSKHSDFIFLNQQNNWINGSIECSDGSCIKTDKICNEVEDCMDGEDEKHCYSPNSIDVIKNFLKNAIPLESDLLLVEKTNHLFNNTTKCHVNGIGWMAARMCDGIPLCDNFEDECLIYCKEHPPFCTPGFSCLFGQHICNGRWDSDSQCPNGRILEEEIGCPQRFYCKNGSIISVRLSQVCDGIENCMDGSDEFQERNCTDDRFYCESRNNSFHSPKNPLFIPRSSVFDGKLDCADGSDECPAFFEEDSYSLKQQMISSWMVKIFLFIMGFVAIFGNFVVFYSSAKELRSSKDQSLIIKLHLILILNLSVADWLMGGYLLVLCALSWFIFPGKFCLLGKAWRVSNFCSAVGTIVIISTEASAFILLIMAIVRFYTVLKPFGSLYSKKVFRNSIISLIASWVLAISLGAIPWFFDGFVTHYYYKSLFFKRDVVKKSDYHHYGLKLTELIKLRNLQIDEALEKRHLVLINGSLENKTFISNQIPKTNHLGEFGFYSQNSICLPNYITRYGKPGWAYTLMIITVNFLLFFAIATLYLFTAYFGNPLRNQLLKRAAMNKNVRKALYNQKSILHKRVARLIVTDFLCWIPLCALSYAHLLGATYEKRVTGYFGIFFLPINSALNPILYSGLYDHIVALIWKKIPCKKNCSGLNTSTNSRLQSSNRATSVNYVKTCPV